MGSETDSAGGLRPPRRGLEAGGVRWWLRADLEGPEIAARLQRALALGRCAHDLKSGRRKSLYPLDLVGSGATDHLLKVNRYRDDSGPPRRGIPATWQPWRPRSKARRELRVAETLATCGLPVRVPIAAGERRRRGQLDACFLLSPYDERWQDLERLWAEGRLGHRDRLALAAALGTLVRRAHAAGLDHGDLRPNNVLVRRDDASELLLIDFERARLRGRLTPRRRARCLATLARAFPDAGAALRLRFLRAYAGGDAAAARRWWGEAARAISRLAARDHAHTRRAARVEGRRFRRVEGPGWHGFARRDAPERLVAAVSRASATGGERGRRCASDGLWLARYPGISPRHARELWARANSLFARGLGPRPVALLFDAANEPVLGLEAGASGALRAHERSARATPAQRRAAERLLAQLLALGRLDPRADRGALALPVDGTPALLVAPEVFRFSSRGADATSRAIADRLLADLG